MNDITIADAVLAPLMELSSFLELKAAVSESHTPVLATGVIDVQEIQIVAGLCRQMDCPALMITHNEIRARELWQDMQFFRKDAVFYPAKDILFYSADVHSKDIIKQRLHILESLLLGQRPIMILSVEALFDRLLPKDVFSSFVITLRCGDELNLDDFFKRLILLGYERTEVVEGVGQFAMRGGILDIFSPTWEQAVRIEFWDTEIDSIRSMDIYSQRSIENLESIRIFPVAELAYEREQAIAAADKIFEEYDQVSKALLKKGLDDVQKRLEETMLSIVEQLREEQTCHNAESFVNYFCDDTVSLLSYLPEDTVICFDEPARIRQHIDILFQEYSQSIQSRMEKGVLLPSQSNMLLSYEQILMEAKGFPQVLFTTLLTQGTDFEVKKEVNFYGKGVPSFQKRMELFIDELKRLKKQQDSRILLLAGAQTRCERLVKELLEQGLVAAFVSDLSKKMEKGSLWVSTGKLSAGFQYPSIGFTVFSDKQLFGESSKKSRRKKKKGAAIQSFSDLNIGDYVVHDNHGIGIFRGLEKITVENVSKDYMKISYANGSNLFVPVSQMDVIQKYIGSGAGQPKINKLGGQEWGKAKQKARSAVKILAQDLVSLYAKRMSAKGYAYAPDNLWQREFEETFPFEETEDQWAAIEDVKADMQSTRVMDRLICGDVGYGKTEVAIRAAFKAVQEGKQVAYLVPTTILAQQHFHTFTQRMADFPIKIELLSRFRTPKQQKESLESLKKGYSDIVIGTHRILSKDVMFKDLGMVIVDEEQRFGVSHKEKLKALSENVDVLTLTATPIPRTLHMSLSGIRDMSILEEPPQERHPIQTYVMENDMELVREAIQRELNRGGQVYYLYNRVQGIAEEASRLRKLIPNCNISYAHGQMTERELENIMEDFIQGEIQVLVCTTIIETGMDISNVNTIIIQDADRMGLSQLYQLRGRVGRSNRIAYAYLMYRRDKVLKEEAEKRLQTIREFTEFGSGFKIAMRDLEIRGAGNLLGAEQHGHMEAVGYDMYCRLLDEEVHKQQGEEIEEQFETTVDLNINAFIPDFYIKNQLQRMELYKKIAAVCTLQDYYDIQEELEDRFGDLPKSVQTLLEVVLLKAQAHRLDIISIVQKQNSIVLTFKAEAKIDPVKLTKLIAANKSRYLFTAGANPYLTIRMKANDQEPLLDYIKNLLHALED